MTKKKKNKKIRTLGYMINKLNKWSRKIYGEDYEERQSKILVSLIKPEEDETLHDAIIRVFNERNYYKKQYKLLLEEHIEEIEEDDCI